MWLEWRPVSSTLGAPGAKDEGKPQQSWTRLNERSPRVTSGEVFVIRGAVEIDVDILAGHGDIVRFPHLMLDMKMKLMIRNIV